MGIASFKTGYLDPALDRLDEVVETAKAELADVDFDTLVGTGFSGGIVIPALALAMGKHFVLIRKEYDDSHHGAGKLIGNLGERWIFVDDFECTGRTRLRVVAKVEAAATLDDHVTVHVGNYFYVNTSNRFTPTEHHPEEG